VFVVSNHALIGLDLFLCTEVTRSYVLVYVCAGVLSECACVQNSFVRAGVCACLYVERVCVCTKQSVRAGVRACLYVERLEGVMCACVHYSCMWYVCTRRVGIY
jgi:hypothetical protein